MFTALSHPMQARDFAPSIEVKKLIEAYDAEGPMAFEDEAGTWIKNHKDKGELLSC